MEFKDILKQLRKSKGIRQDQLADVLGVERSSISKWERGANNPTSIMMQKIANYFDVSIDYLTGRKIEDNSFSSYKRNEQSIRLLHSFAQLNSIGKKEAIKRVDELLQIPKYANKSADTMPIAAHTDAEITDKELELMRQDIDEL